MRLIMEAIAIDLSAAGSQRSAADGDGKLDD